MKKAFTSLFTGKKGDKKAAPPGTEGSAVEIVPQGPVTNLHSKNTFSNQDLTTVLSNLSVGDTKHDFSYTKGDFDLQRFKASFNAGIPAPYSEVLKEAQCLASVVKSYSIDNGATNNIDTEYSPIRVANPGYTSGRKSQHGITTVNGNSYQVNYMDVKATTEDTSILRTVKKMLSETIKGTKLIDAPTFYRDLSLNTGPNEKIAIVVDAASIGLYDILNKGTFTEGARPVVYYMFGAEVVNDPATKKSPDAKEFKQGDGVKFIPCVPKEINKNQYYNYHYENPDENTPFIKQFYTNYQFQLSELKKSVKGRSFEYITNLNIFGKKNGELNILPNSKSKNDITFLTSFLQKFLDIIRRGAETITEKQRFLFSSALQQKRSGDWLQVLLCAAIKDNLTQFVQYDNKDEVNDFDRVFLVTHDQIALAFALLMGIDCIFTHHNSTLHFHSAFVYKILNPEADNIRKLALAEIIVNKLKDTLISNINKLIRDIDAYQRSKYDVLTNQKNNLLNRYLNVELDKIKKDSTGAEKTASITPDSRGDQENASPLDSTGAEKNASTPPNSTGEYTYTITNKDNDNKYNVSWFNRDTRAIFTAALEAMISKNIIPNLSDQIDVLNNIIHGIDESLNNDRLSNNIDLVIQNYNTYNTQYENIRKIYDTANSLENGLFENKIRAFKKSNIYKRAAEWTWDINISSREVAFMENDATSTYNSDRNIFLYNLNELDDGFKQRITFIYYKYYTFLLYRCTLTTIDTLKNYFRNGTDKIEARPYIKFRAVALSFCTEVLLTLGGVGVDFYKGVTTTANPTSPVTLTPSQIVDTMEGFLARDPRYISRLLTDEVVVQEDTSYNNAPNKISADSLAEELEVPVINEDSHIVDTEVLPHTNDEDLPGLITMHGGEINTEIGPFMTTIKQATYPLLTFIMNITEYYHRVRDYLFSQKVDIVDEDIVDEGIILSESHTSFTPENDATASVTTRLDVPLTLEEQRVAERERREMQRAARLIQRAVRNKMSANINKNVLDFYGPTFNKIVAMGEPKKTNSYQHPRMTTRGITVNKEKGGQSYPRKTSKEKDEKIGGETDLGKLPTKKGEQNGGSIQNLRSLFASLPKPSSETPITFYNTTDIFQDNTICFHPLLPIYMITQTYMSAINNEHIEESLDFDLFVNYLNFLKKIKEKVVEIYSGENNTNINKLEAYAIGLGLKQLLFVSNNTNEGYRDCVKVLNADDNIYRSVSSLTDVLCTAICGKITHADIVLLEGPIYLNSDLFTQFARSLNVNRIFGFYVDTTNFDLSNFKAQVLEFSNELAEQIIADRNGRSTVPISSASSISAPIRSSDDVGSGLKPFDPSRVKTGKDIGFTYSSDGDLEKPMKSPISSGYIPKGKGGKKSRKHKEKVKRQTRKHKKQSKNIKHKTRKHKKYAKKTRRSTSV